ncbi:MAG TPA: cytochrome c oxidase subunit II [Candidatus Methylomirabilis sp.]|nr:cytochrome c oxidase subunit II [Candidatus Methylomirabilis sp.]
MWKNLPLFPEQASSMASQVDGLYLFLVSVSVFFTLLIFALVFVFAVKFRKSAHAKAEHIEGSLPLELTWTLIPLGITMIFFAWGALIYFQEARPPRGAMEVYAVGKQWMWKFEHETGQREINALHVPVGRDVKMIMSSQDVIHSFYVPAFRIKQDVLPGRYTTTWFRPTKVGTYHLFCAEYCGTEHSGMIGEVVVMEATAYQAWLANGGATASMSANGKELFSQLGCATCHRFDTQGRGPNLVGIFGKPVQLNDGRTVMADENYIRESILNPQAKIVAGFQPIMPTFQGQVTEESLGALVSYVKSLSQPQQKAEGGTPQPAAASESN